MRHIEGMTMQYTEVLSAQCVVLSQRLGALRKVLRFCVRLPSWNAPAPWSSRTSPHNRSTRRTLSGRLSTGHWALGTLFLAFFICLTPAYSQGLNISLVSEQTAIVPGKPFTLGLWLQHPEGSHTYWRSPGIVGVPTQMEWQLPKGWKASTLIYPEPERTFMYQIKAQGYDRDVMLRTEITPPADLKSGTQVTLTGQASWMCCGNSCNPGTRELSIALPVVATQSEVALNEKWHKLLEAERARVERPSAAWSASTVSEKSGILTFTLKPATPEARVSQDQDEAAKIIVFTEDGWFDSDEPQTVTRQPDGSLLITLTKADAFLGSKPPDTLRAILRNEQGWLKGETLRCLQIEPEIKR